MTRRPCKGDKSEIEMLVFVGLVKKCLQHNMDIHFDWQARDSSVKICVSPAR